MAPKPPKPLPGFLKFVQKVRPFLIRVQRDDLDSLLKCLYLAAERKMKLEESRLAAPEGHKETRKARKSMAQTRKLFNQALSLLRKAVVENWEQVSIIDGSVWASAGDGVTIAYIIRYLEDAVKRADDCQLLFASFIHPDLRRRAEKKMAKQKLNLVGIEAGTIVPYRKTVRPDSPQIDHWFIGAAADCLDQFRTGAGRKIPGYDQIIFALFQIAFGDFDRSVQSIQIELRRQKKDKRPTIFVDVE